MIWKLSVLVLLCSIIVLVKSESYIEVDENGDEYDVKKFYIQGRQLNDSPQCVVTRKRRATDSSRQYSVEPVYEPDEALDESIPAKGDDVEEDLDDNEEEDEGQDVIRVGDTEAPNADMKSNKTASGSLLDDMKKPEDMKPMVKPTKMETSSLLLPQKTEENKEKEEEGGTLVAVHKIPTKNKLQKVTIIRPQANEETLNQAEELPQQSFQVVPASLLSNSANNEFIVINAQQPQTSLASSLSSLLQALPSNEDYEYGENLPPFSWTYSNQPISTSAIWSTGDNIINNAFNRIYNGDKFQENFSSSDVVDPNFSTYPQTQELRPSRPVLNRPPKKKVVTRRPVKNTRPGSQGSPVRRPMRPNRNGRPGQPIRRPQSTKRKPNKKINPVANRPTNRPSNIGIRNPNKNNKKRKSNKPANSASFSQQNSNNKIKRKKNKKNTKPGVISSTYTRSVTETGNDSNIDCIIINKDKEVTPKPTTTSTTARPFWNVFGRRASNTAQSRDFGNRKRVNLRFRAS